MPQSDFHSPVVNAGPYPTDRLGVSGAVLVPAEVLSELRRARVQLYCGRNIQAVGDIRAARERLRCHGAPLQMVALQELDAASWLAGHGHAFEATEALDAALARLETAGGRF